MSAPPTVAALPLQLGAIASVPGILGTIIVVAIVIFVARFVLSIAWKLTIVAAVVVTVLWFLGLLGPLGGVF